MLQFKGPKKLEEVQAACDAKGFVLDRKKYDGGADWVTVTGTFDGQEMQVIYSPHNGKFIGKTPTGDMFSEASGDLDATPWYVEILNFFNRPMDAAEPV